MTTTERLKALLDARREMGLAKYGTTVDRTDLKPSQWCQHAIEELLDGAAYLMRERDRTQELERELAEAKERIARLEKAGDAMVETYEEIETEVYGIERIDAWRKAKETKPQLCKYCMEVECDCSDFDVDPDMGAK